jgi:hypothetical protein
MSQFPNLNDDFTKRLITGLWRTTITVLVVLAAIKACTPDPIHTP